MSKTVELDLTCPQCQKQWKATAYRSIWVEFQENLDLILNDRINLVKCPSCGFSDRLPLAFLATNVGKRAAIWYEPYPDPHVDSDHVLYLKHYGEDSFYAKAPRVQDWAEFKRRLVQLNSQPDVPATMEDLVWITKGLKSSTSEIVRQKPKPLPDKVEKIARLVDALRVKGHKIPSRVSEIPGFPCRTFDDLRTKLSTRELILYRPGLNYSSDTFTLMATRSESAAFYVSILLMCVLPFIAIALAILVNWPWILACPFLVYTGWKMGRSAYTRTIFRSATESEINFCFLFYGYRVGVALPDFSKVYFWEGPHRTRP
jgi:Zn ribbon nucleic-acid-binding protein